MPAARALAVLRDPGSGNGSRFIAGILQGRAHRLPPVTVEHPFRIIKRQFGYLKVRYRGLMMNTQQLHTLFALRNLWMMRHRLQPGAKL